MGRMTRNASFATAGNEINVAAINASSAAERKDASKHHQRKGCQPVIECQRHDHLLIERCAEQRRDHHAENKTPSHRENPRPPRNALPPDGQAMGHACYVGPPPEDPAAQEQMLREVMDSQRNDHCHEIAYPETQEGKLHRILSAKGNIGANQNDWIYDGRGQHVSDCIRYRQALVNKRRITGTTPAFAHGNQPHRSTQANSEEGVSWKKAHHHAGGEEFVNDSREQECQSK